MDRDTKCFLVTILRGLQAHLPERQPETTSNSMEATAVSANGSILLKLPVDASAREDALAQPVGVPCPAPLFIHISFLCGAASLFLR